MKTLILTIALLAPISALANPSSPTCRNNAAKFAEQNKAHNGYDRDGFWGVSCELAPNQKAVICEVAASKGRGAATDTYQVVMNATCTKALRVELTGEE